jgi:hypothetical protein
MRKRILLLLFIGTVLNSCTSLLLDEEPAQNPQTVFEFTWKEVEDKYPFFELKGINWQSVKQKYQPRIAPQMSEEALFDVLAEMVNETRDAHVNLASPFNVSFYTPVFLNAPENFNARLVEQYYLFPNDYYLTGGFDHSLLDNNEVLYLRYESFSLAYTQQQLDYVFNRASGKRGLIIDLRNNLGGSISSAFDLAYRLADQSRLVIVSQVKNGPGALDYEVPVNGSVVKQSPGYSGPTVVLVNRKSYSATNLFAAMVREFPQVTLMGDTTGGGGGVPVSRELPNGWVLRLSGTRTFGLDGLNLEQGVPPDRLVYLSADSMAVNRDNMIEEALRMLRP